jgi:hypothetical protein
MIPGLVQANHPTLFPKNTRSAYLLAIEYVMVC